MDPFAELRAAMLDYDDWPTDEKRAKVIDLARCFVRAVDQRAAVIEQLRQIKPSDQALAELLKDV